MKAIRLTPDDCSLLCCLVDGGSRLADWIRVYTFVQRTAVPGYDELAGCVNRATAAGVMRPPTDGVYRLTTEWQARRDEFVASTEVTEYGLFEFAEWLEDQTLPAARSEAYILSRDEFDRAVGHGGGR